MNRYANTTRTLWVIVAMLGAVAVPGRATLLDPSSILVNGSVELGSSNTQADNWTLHPGDTFRETIPVFGFTGTAMADGNYAVKEFGGDGSISQTNLAINAGRDYIASGWFYHSSTQDVIDNSANSTRMFMHVEWFNGSLVPLRDDYTTSHNGTSPADVWTEIQAVFTPPTGAAFATFFVESDSNVGGGSVFGDAFNFIPVPEPSTLMLLASGGWLLYRACRMRK